MTFFKKEAKQQIKDEGKFVELEGAEMGKVIIEDLKMLKIQPDQLTRTSDHFDLLINYCEQLLKDGKAYVDDTDSETMRKEREERIESKNRNNSPGENMSLWNEMLLGTEK
uniref:Glutamyl/glutaminyl-tRNA synthetase class Ib catalytic domain-containing protein n=1 Tax=Meloidogyne javanica TaxID=6303 RepID=A0A915N484_MELJA